MKVLVIHNILWSHYKSALFEALCKNKPDSMEIMILQIAKNELSRKSMENAIKEYKYNSHLLFNDYIEEIPRFKKIFAVIKFIKKFKPDLINFHGFGIDLSITLSIFYAFFLKSKIVISSESTNLDSNKNFIKNFIKKIIVKNADGFIVFGQSSKRYILDFGVNENKIIEEKAAVVDEEEILKSFSFIENDNYLNSIIKSKFNFIYVGRILEIKNITLLISTFQNIKKQNEKSKEWGLIILGNGEDDEKVENLIKKSPNHIYKFNSVPWDKVPVYFRFSECLILPSKVEPWGLVVNEAMICGLGVIVSDKCGCKDDLVDGNGFVFKPESPTELTQSMLNFIENVELNKQMKLKSKEIIKDFKLDTVAKRILLGFQNILEK